jgi:glycosyltransferase involved in cell wall biosynthesis
VNASHIKFSVVLPAYNEADTIALALIGIEKVLNRMAAPYEIILVCDGDSDQTSEEAINAQITSLKILSYTKNQGKGFAIRHGVSQAVGETLIIMDADLDLDPSRIPELVHIYTVSKLDLLVGSKMHPDSIVAYPKARRLMSSAYRILIRKLFGFEISDTQTGLKICKRDCFNRVYSSLHENGFAFDLELITVFVKNGFLIGEGPITLNYQFSSSINAKSILRMLRSTYSIYRSSKNG